jgi:hypothetical protein
MTYNLFIDDERDPVITSERPYWIIARSVDDVKEIISSMGWPSYVSFDHDLGENVGTGMEFARYMVECHLDGQEVFTDNFDYYVHSQNLAGAQNIRYLIDSFLATIRN